MDEFLKLPVGIDNFEKIRRNGFYYVDKTSLIEQLFSNWGKLFIYPSAPFWKNTQYEQAEIFLLKRTDRSLLTDSTFVPEK